MKHDFFYSFWAYKHYTFLHIILRLKYINNFGLRVSMTNQGKLSTKYPRSMGPILGLHPLPRVTWHFSFYNKNIFKSFSFCCAILLEKYHATAWFSLFLFLSLTLVATKNDPFHKLLILQSSGVNIINNLRAAFTRKYLKLAKRHKLMKFLRFGIFPRKSYF